ncbi:MAG: NAD-dependent epimerase/dehydratase family protein [Magnetospirillum sp.]|nr:NAD-dependent epimerase/dehydratase family protein [Magnetospirillum sp.]
MRNFLVTGGCGFIGQGLIRALAADPANRIRVVDNLCAGKPEALDGIRPLHRVEEPDWADPAIQLLVGDIADAALAVKAASGADAIIHLAANTGVGPSVQDPRADCMTNIIGTFNYLEAARQGGVRRFVFASSGAVVGEVTPPIVETLPACPVSPYGASKLAGEGYCSAYWRTFGIATTALRFGNVYGPGSAHKESVVAKFIRHALAGEALEVYGDGSQTRDFIFIDDLIEAIRLSLTADSAAAGEVFQIAAGRETTLAEMLDSLLPALESEGVAGIRVTYTQPRLGDVARNCSDTSKARDILGWTARHGLPEGLGRTVRWFLGRI